MPEEIKKPELSNVVIGEQGQFDLLVSPQYEYLLKFWGQIENDNLVEKELGVKEKNFWFKTKEERRMMKSLIENIAKRNNVIVAFSEEEGMKVRYKTIAKMILEYEGIDYPYEYDFGYGYPANSAQFMFEDGNYSCDCNRSLFLADAYPQNFKRDEELECGDKITMKSLTIHFR
jgi:hypothetical protein